MPDTRHPSGAPDTAGKRLDQELEQSFPASDPPSVTRDSPAPAVPDAAARQAACAQKAEKSHLLDDALDDSFPASDPPAIIQPHRPEEDAEGTDCPLP